LLVLQHQKAKMNMDPTSVVDTSCHSYLRLVAAGKGKTMSCPAVVQTVLDLIVYSSPEDDEHDDFYHHNERPRLVYLGTASYDDDARMEPQIEGYREYCEIIPLRVSEAMTSTPSLDEIATTLESAHIILASGGNTLYAVNRWKQLGMDEMLHDAACRGAVICGGSAGAISWFADGHSDSMNPTSQLHVDPNLTQDEKENWQYVRVKALGVFPAMCVPHHDTTRSNGIRRCDDADTMMHQNLNQPCIGIDEGAALVVKDNQVRVVSADHEAKVYVKRCVATSGTQGYKVVSKQFSEKDGSTYLQNLLTGTF
jgi:peptidase E